jgi:hypothetical protein
MGALVAVGSVAGWMSPGAGVSQIQATSPIMSTLPTDHKTGSDLQRQKRLHGAPYLKGGAASGASFGAWVFSMSPSPSGMAASSASNQTIIASLGGDDARLDGCSQRRQPDWGMNLIDESSVTGDGQALLFHPQ